MINKMEEKIPNPPIYDPVSDAYYGYISPIR